MATASSLAWDRAAPQIEPTRGHRLRVAGVSQCVGRGHAAGPKSPDDGRRTIHAAGTPAVLCRAALFNAAMTAMFPANRWPAHGLPSGPGLVRSPRGCARPAWRSEEHTSELQSQSNLVCRLLLEK